MENTPILKNGLFWLGVTLAIGLVISFTIFSGAVKSVAPNQKTIMVKGMAEKEILSDYASWSGSFSVQCINLADGYNQIQNQKETILSFFERKGINRKDITLAAIVTMAQYKMNENGVSTDIRTGYILSQTLSISSKDVNLISRIADESTELIKEGIEFISNVPNYYYTKYSDLKIEMLGAATADAKKRADVIATNSGGNVGVLASASQGVFQITSTYSTEVSDYGENDIYSIKKSIKAVVNLEFYIK